MDEPGFHARRRAAKADAFYAQPSQHHEQHVQPLNEGWGGEIEIPNQISYGYSEPSYRPPESVDPLSIPGATQAVSRVQGSMTVPGPSLSAVERSKSFPQPLRMTPHLQFMCGPLLRYDTVEEGIWHGAIMIVTADAGSQYSPGPSVSLDWDPEQPRTPVPSSVANGSHPNSPTTEAVPPFDFDPHASGSLPPVTHQHSFTPSNGHSLYPKSDRAQSRTIPGQEIYVYHGTGGTFTFWRFMIEVPLAEVEMGIRYRVNGGAATEFFVPAVDQNMRWATHSCNGFSAGVNPDDFRGPGYASGYDPVWTDLLNKHMEKPFHALVGGGDQIYCDGLTRERELQEWANLESPEDKINYSVTDTIRFAIDRYLFSHYCLMFRNGVFARCNRSIPMVNMLDDHDLIDGFGSYPTELQSSPIFSTIGSRGYFFFLLFQQFTVDAVDGTHIPAPTPHPNKALILGGEGPWIPYRTHSLLAYLGPKVYILLIDCRAERRKEQICSKITYDAIWESLKVLPPSVEHLVVQLGIPIAYPRMNFLEATLDSKLNPLVLLGRAGALGMSGFVNKFNKEAELLDDLNDHWTAKHHKKERNGLIEQFQTVALGMKLRVSFLSGDVHCAAVGVLKTLAKTKKSEVQPSLDHRYMINVVTSAIVNTPPPHGVITMVGVLGNRKHKTMHHLSTDESMLPIFKNDPNGTPLKAQTIMGRRNWCSVELDEMTSDLVFDIRVESQKGYGVTVGYPVRTPPPRWSS